MQFTTFVLWVIVENFIPLGFIVISQENITSYSSSMAEKLGKWPENQYLWPNILGTIFLSDDTGSQIKNQFWVSLLTVMD